MSQHSGSTVNFPAALPKRRFRNRVLLYLFLLSIPPLLVWGSFAYNRSLQFVSDFYERELLTATRDVALRIQWAQQEDSTFARYLALEIGHNPRTDWQRVARQMIEAEPALYSVHVVGPDGVDLVRSDDAAMVNYSDRTYFQTAMKGVGSHEMLLSRVFNQRPAICTSEPVWKNKPKVVDAVMVVCRFLTKELLQLDAIRFGQTSSVFLTDGIKKFSIYPTFEMRTNPTNSVEDIAQKSASAHREGHLEFENEGSAYVSFRVPLENNWQLVALQEKTEIFSEARQFLAGPALVAVFCLLLLLIAAVIAIDRSIRPLSKLTAAAEALGPGNLQIRVPVESDDEMGILARAFNNMADRLRDAFASLKAQEVLLNRSNEDLEEQISRQSEKLAYSTKMSSLGEMAGSIAHEVNNPLAIISLRTQRLRQKIEKDEFDKPLILETLDKIETTCLRINQIVRGLRAFSRDGSHDPMVLENLSSIVQDAIALCVETARNRGVEIRSNCPESIEVECQPVQIGQVMLNLLNNARDAAEQLPNARWIEVSCGTDGSDALIRVSDSGGGVPEELRQKIMQPFFTTKKFGEGTGLGLSISKGILEQHHGTLTLDADSKVTCFVMRLPLRQPTA